MNLYAYCHNNPVRYVDPTGHAREFNDVSYAPSVKWPKRTKEATEQCDLVVKALNKIKNGEGMNPVVCVFVHKDHSVSIGISGRSGSYNTQRWANELQNELNKLNNGRNYTVSDHIDAELRTSVENKIRKLNSDNSLIPLGYGNQIGDCAEPKAASAAHHNPSEVTGMDVRNRNGKHNHPYTGDDKVSDAQMDPCDTCSACGDEYMDYANANKNVHSKGA